MQAEAAQGLQGLHGLQAEAAQGLQGLHFAAAQGLHFAAAHGLHFAAAQGLHFAAAQGLHFAAAQGLHFAAAQGLGLAAAQGLHFAAAHCAMAGAILTPSVKSAPPAATPAKTISGMKVLERSARFLELIVCLPNSWAFDYSDLRPRRARRAARLVSCGAKKRM